MFLSLANSFHVRTGLSVLLLSAVENTLSNQLDHILLLDLLSLGVKNNFSF
jgi:hypothetical protein